MEFDKIGDWSQADLRRYIVNLLNSDPGALPKEVGGVSQQLPVAADGDVPVWDAAANSWTTSTAKPVSPLELAVPADASKVLNGLGAFIGGFTKLFDSTLGGSAANIDTGASGVPQTHQHLLILTTLRSDRAVIAEDSALRFGSAGGALDTGTNYNWTQIPIVSGAVTGSQALSTTTALYGVSASASSGAGIFSAGMIFIPAYRSGNAKHWIGFGGQGGSSGRVVAGHWYVAGAIDRVAAIPAVGPNYVATSRMVIYGIG